MTRSKSTGSYGLVKTRSSKSWRANNHISFCHLLSNSSGSWPSSILRTNLRNRCWVLFQKSISTKPKSSFVVFFSENHASFNARCNKLRMCDAACAARRNLGIRSSFLFNNSGKWCSYQQRTFISSKSKPNPHKPTLVCFRLLAFKSFTTCAGSSVLFFELPTSMRPNQSRQIKPPGCGLTE